MQVINVAKLSTLFRKRHGRPRYGVKMGQGQNVSKWKMKVRSRAYIIYILKIYIYIEAFGTSENENDTFWPWHIMTPPGSRLVPHSELAMGSVEKNVSCCCNCLQANGLWLSAARPFFLLSCNSCKPHILFVSLHRRSKTTTKPTLKMGISWIKLN